jgi:hypothetical protein
MATVFETQIRWIFGLGRFFVHYGNELFDNYGDSIPPIGWSQRLFKKIATIGNGGNWNA